MKIDLANLADEGQHFEGELSPEIFDLQESDIISVSALKYSLFTQRFDTELLLTGSLEATFELTCMRSLHPFKQTISMPSAAVSIELGNDGIIDPAPQIREEILLELPTNPRCEDGDAPANCEIDPKYLAVDKPTDDGVEPARAPEKPNPWGALDVLDSQD
ncbi:MAG: hypothetical protein P8M04_02055 [Akkermansiaceae bacterium]|jgi:uncharacterized metal-binding protein YceD (DUF177 family)|nr:hypothetical protein [Akkermansiaceae bacterium]